MTLFTQSGSTTLAVLLMLMLVIGWVLFRTHRALSRQRSSSTLVHTPRPQGADRGHHLDSPDDVLRWEVQMHETARELSAQLESKMGSLQALISEADRAAARLEAAAAGTPPPTPRTAEPDAQPTTQAEALLSPDGSYRAGEDEAAIDTSEQSSPRSRQEEVYTLADYGFSPAEIAARIGRPIGEVELILGLRNKK